MGSYLFDGTDDFIEYPANVAALSLSQYLILAWMRRTGGHANGRICSRGPANSTAADHMQLMVGDASTGLFSNTFSLRQAAATNLGRVVATPVGDTTIQDNAWFMVGGSYIEDGAMQLRRNGADQAAGDAGRNSAPAGATTTRQTDKFYIGSTGGSARPFGGQIAYFGVWDIAGVSTGDVQSLVTAFYNSGTGTADVPRQDILVDFVPLDASGAISGSLGVITGTASGATYDSGNSPPVTYNAIGNGDANVIAVPANATGDSPDSVVAGSSDTNQTSPAADGTGDCPNPTVTASSVVAAVAATGLGSAPISGNASSAEVGAPAATAVQALSAPGVTGSGGADVTAVPASATGAVAQVALVATATVSAVTADGTGDAPAPVVAGELGALVEAVPADCVGYVPAPVVSDGTVTEVELLWLPSIPEIPEIPVLAD